MHKVYKIRISTHEYRKIQPLKYFLMAISNLMIKKMYVNKNRYPDLAIDVEFEGK